MKRVVLVDDDRDDAELFEEALEEVNNTLHFQHFENAQTALAEWSKTNTMLPDVIFLDLNLPQVSGWEILQQLRQIKHLASIPVVMYTTSSQRHEEKIAQDLGANYFITKPTDYKELKILLTEILRKVLV